MTDTSPHTPPPEARSTPDLISQAFQHLGNLVKGEINLARAEITDGLQTAVAGIAMMAGALVMVLVGLNILAAAIVAGLTEMGLHPRLGGLHRRRPLPRRSGRPRHDGQEIARPVHPRPQPHRAQRPPRCRYRQGGSHQ